MKVLSIVPGSPDRENNFTMAIKQIEKTLSAGCDNQLVYLGLSISPLNILRKVIKIYRFVWRDNPDIIHAHYGSLAAFVGFLVFWKPLIITYRGSDLNPDKNVHWLKRMAVHFMSQVGSLRASHIFCVSDQLAKRLWFRRKNISVFPDGIDFNIFKPLDPVACRSQLGLSTESKIIAFYSSGNRPLKRRDVALAVHAEVKKSIPNAEFLEMPGNIAHEKVPTYLSAADCLILTSEQEGSPNIIKEALACRTPVVSFDVGDVKKWLHRDPVSSVVAQNDRATMANKVKDLFNRDVVKNRSINIDEVDMNNINSRIIAEYSRIANRGRHLDHPSRPMSPSH